MLVMSAVAAAQPQPRSGALEAFHGPLSARASGMGGAYTSVADDVDSIAYNPAGLSRLQEHKSRIFAGGGMLSLDRQLNMLALAHRFDGSGTLAVALLHAEVADIEGYDTQGNSTGIFNERQLALNAAWAGEAGYQFRYGVALKGVSHELAGSTAAGYGMDLGVWVMPSLGSYMAIGAVLQNASSLMTWDTGRQERADPLLRMGISDRFFSWRLLLSLDLDLPLGGQGRISPKLGGEYWFGENYALRAGLSDDAPSAGASWKVSYYLFDYAYIHDTLGLGASHHVAVTLRF
jgi:hypothetical protein